MVVVLFFDEVRFSLVDCGSSATRQVSMSSCCSFHDTPVAGLVILVVGWKIQVTIVGRRCMFGC